MGHRVILSVFGQVHAKEDSTGGLLSVAADAAEPSVACSGVDRFGLTGGGGKRKQ